MTPPLRMVPNAGGAGRARPRTTATRPKRESRAAKREKFYIAEIEAAPEMLDALAISFDWLRGEIKKLMDTRPDDVEWIAWHCTQQIANLARSVHKAKQPST